MDVVTGGALAPSRGHATTEPSEVIVFSEAAVRLGERTVWCNVDIRITAGEFVAVLGPNGAGKSTLLRAILGLQALSAGRVEVLGQPARRGNPDVGYLPQRHGFDPDLRVRGIDLVRLGLDGTRWGVPLPRLRGSAVRGRRATRRHVDEVIELVGAGDYARRPIGELSGGEQQRLLIAQALVSGPRLLLLDEPLDSLDITNQQQICALVSAICREREVAVLLVAHDVNVILPHLDRVVYIARERALMGAPSEVITTQTLSRLYGSPIDVLSTRDGRLLVVGQSGEPITQGHGHGDAG